jgi:hypothetical protein
MATPDRTQINELMAQAEGLEFSLTQIGLLEEAVRLADLLGDVPLGFDARTRLIKAANFGGAPEKSMVAFSWCLAQLDKDPERYPLRDVLWQYKWVISDLPSFPQLSRAQITSAMADLGRRIEQAGYGMRPVYKLQSCVARDMGDFDEYHAAHARWLKSPHGGLSDCSACDLDSEVDYLAECGRDEEAVTRARTILNGTSRCAVVPHCTLAKLLLPFVRLGRLDEAVKHHLKGYRLISRNRHHLNRVGQHIQFLALTDNLAKGTKLFETHLHWALDTFDGFDRFRFVLPSTFLFDRLKASGKKTLKLRLPSTFPIYEESGKYGVPELLGWLESDAAELARRFDDRNGNNAFAAKIETTRALESQVKPFPLRPRGKASDDPTS